MHIAAQYWHKGNSLNHCSIKFLIEQLKLKLFIVTTKPRYLHLLFLSLSHGQTNWRDVSEISGDRLQCVGLLAEPGGSSGHYTGVYDICIHTVTQDQPLEIMTILFITD